MQIPEKKSKIDELSIRLYLKKLEEQQQNKSKESKQQEIMTIKAEISEIESKEII